MSVVIIMKSGIYKIENTVNGKVYIGSSKYVKGRIEWHERELNKKTHGNSYLQKTWDKYGKNCFKFEVIENCSIDLLIEREQYWMDYYQSYDSGRGYNLVPKAGSNLGFRHSEKSKKKMSLSLTGNTCRLGTKASEETRKKLSIVAIGNKNWLGKHRSEETKKKLSKKIKGRIHSKEAAEKIRQASLGNTNMLGKKHSEETKNKMSLANKGKIFSEEHRKNISLWQKGKKKKPLSEEHKKKISINNGRVNLGKKFSEETRRKMSDSHKGKKPNITKEQSSIRATKGWETRKSKYNIGELLNIVNY